MYLDHWIAAVSILAAFLIIAVAHRATVRAGARTMRRVAVLCSLYLTAVAVVSIGRSLGWDDSLVILERVAGIFGWLTVIELFTSLLFRVTLPRLGVHPPSIIGDLFLGGAIIVLVVITLRAFGVNATGIAATSAVFTAIIAIGLQATLGNIVGGIALQIDKSIRVGDWIQLENGTQGRVQEIHWRHTVIETRDWDTIIVPNATLLAANIMILGKRDGCPIQHRMWVYFNVDFRYHPQQVIDTVEKALRADPPIPNVAADPPPNCVCQDFASDQRESYGLYAVRYWLSDLHIDDPTSSLIRERVFAALRRAGIPLAIPAAQLYLDHDSVERRERKVKIDMDQRVAALRSIEFLSMLNDEELRQLSTGLKPVYYAHDETIMKQGDEADWLYIMTEGVASVWVSANDMESHVADLRAPTFFGEMGLMTGAPRAATVIATEAATCYRLYRESFHDIIKQRPQIATQISEILAVREVEMQTVKEQLDADTQHHRIEEASSNLLGKISTFFGLKD